MNIVYEVPNTKEYLELRIAAGLGSKDEAIVEKSLKHSLFAVVLRGDDSELLGMGRIIGDGAWFYQIVDFVIAPSYQSQGFDDIIMQELTNYLNHNVAQGAEVILMADVPKVSFYQKFGFEFTYPHSISLRKKV
jgi:ribosomal protein S18 acetylase RimI-like enzyme